MARGEILMKAGIVEVVKSIMLSTRNQNRREVGCVASQTCKGSKTERERWATVAYLQQGQAQGVLLQRWYIRQVPYGTTGELKREKRKYKQSKQVGNVLYTSRPFSTGIGIPKSELTVKRFEGDTSPMWGACVG